MAKKFKFKKKIVSKIEELGGSCARSSDSFLELVRSLQLPPMQEFSTIMECVSQDDIENLQAIYNPTDPEKQKKLISFLSNRTKSFTVYKHDSQGGQITNLENEYLINQELIPKFKEFIWGDDLSMFCFGYWDGLCHDCFYICLTDPNPTNPYVYATDHATFFQDSKYVGDMYDKERVYHIDVSYAGTLEEFIFQFLTPSQLNDELVENIVNSEQ